MIEAFFLFFPFSFLVIVCALAALYGAATEGKHGQQSKPF